MKSLEQIKEEYAKEVGYFDFDDLITNSPTWDSEYEVVAKRYATEYAKEALRLASESAEFIAEHQFYEETIKDRIDNVGSHLVSIDKGITMNKIIQTLLIMLALSFVVFVAISPIIVMHLLLGWIGVIIYLILCLFISIYSQLKNKGD